MVFVLISVGYVVSSFLKDNVNVVQVKIGGFDHTVDAVVLHSYLGDGFKNVWQPKVDSKVLVCFLNGDINCGVVLGFLEKKNDDPILKFSKDGDKGLFQHENGTKVEFFNKEGERKIEITTPKEEFVSLDLDNQKLEVKNKKSGETLSVSLDFKDSKVELKSEELTINTKNINITGESVKIDLKNGFDVKSGSVNLSSNGSVDVKASSSANIKGQTINLN